MQAMAEVLSQGCRGSLGSEGALSGRWRDPTSSPQAEQEPLASRRAEGRDTHSEDETQGLGFQTSAHLSDCSPACLIGQQQPEFSPSSTVLVQRGGKGR